MGDGESAGNLDGLVGARFGEGCAGGEGADGQQHGAERQRAGFAFAADGVFAPASGAFESGVDEFAGGIDNAASVDEVRLVGCAPFDEREVLVVVSRPAMWSLLALMRCLGISAQYYVPSMWMSPACSTPERPRLWSRMRAMSSRPRRRSGLWKVSGRSVGYSA